MKLTNTKERHEPTGTEFHETNNLELQSKSKSMNAPFVCTCQETMAQIKSKHFVHSVTHNLNKLGMKYIVSKDIVIEYDS